MTTLLSLPGSKPRHVKNDRRHDKREKYTSLPGSKPRQDHREGRSENRETWFVSRHYDPRTEVWRGDTPKVPKL